MANPILPRNPETGQDSKASEFLALSPETRKVVAELYAAYVDSWNKTLHIPFQNFSQWLEGFAPTIWAEELAREVEALHTDAPSASGESEGGDA